MRKVREVKVEMSSDILTLPSSEALPLLQSVDGVQMDGVPEMSTSEEYDIGLSSWWDSVRVVLEKAFETKEITKLSEKVVEVAETASSTKEEIESINESGGSISGGGPISVLSSSWDGGSPGTTTWETGADGGWAGPRIYGMDGGTPFTDYTYAARPDDSMVDEAKTTDLIKGAYSGGTP